MLLTCCKYCADKFFFSPTIRQGGFLPLVPKRSLVVQSLSPRSFFLDPPRSIVRQTLDPQPIQALHPRSACRDSPSPRHRLLLREMIAFKPDVLCISQSGAADVAISGGVEPIRKMLEKPAQRAAGRGSWPWRQHGAVWCRGRLSDKSPFRLRVGVQMFFVAHVADPNRRCGQLTVGDSERDGVSTRSLSLPLDLPWPSDASGPRSRSSGTSIQLQRASRDVCFETSATSVVRIAMVAHRLRPRHDDVFHYLANILDSTCPFRLRRLDVVDSSTVWAHSCDILPSRVKAARFRGRSDACSAASVMTTRRDRRVSCATAKPDFSRRPTVPSALGSEWIG